MWILRITWFDGFVEMWSADTLRAAEDLVYRAVTIDRYCSVEYL